MHMGCVIKNYMCGSIHGPDSTPYEVWHGHKPDLAIMPPFGSVVMAHVPLKQQDTRDDRSSLNYAVGTAIRHKCAKVGLILFNSLTKWKKIRHIYKIQSRPDYEDEAGSVIPTTVTQNTAEETVDMNDYKYLIGTIHRDDNDLELYNPLMCW